MIYDTCLDCARKHLAAACSQLCEWLTGDYDEEFWFAIGNIWLAECHLICRYPELADKIRQERIKMIEEDNYYIDFRPLIAEITELAEKETKKTKNQGTKK